MKFKLPNAVTTRLAHTTLVAQKHSPQILFASGLVLMGATVITACKGTLALEDVLDEVKKDHDDINRVAASKPEKYSEKEVAKPVPVTGKQPWTLRFDS